MQAIRTRSDVPGRPPRVLIVGSEDVHARIPLLRGLAGDCTPAAAGSSRALAPRFAAAGFPYFYYPLSRGLGPFTDLCALAALWRLMRRWRPQVVHAFDTKPGVYACLAARLAGVRAVIGTVTGLGSLYAKDGPPVVRAVYERLQRLASRHADRTVFQNRDDRDCFVARRVVPAAKATIIAGSGVDTNHLDPARFSAAGRLQVRASLGVPADALLVTLVSRLIRSKGVEDFVAAAAQVRQRFPDAHFLLVGAADRDSVHAFRSEELARFAEVVHCVGPRPDVPTVLAASDLFVLPSYLREGIPRVLLEAASMGLPIVTTNTPGCADVVEDGVNGLLVPARAPAALAEAIGHLLGSAELRRRFGQHSRKRARDEFDLAVVTEQTRSLYAELLARNASRPRQGGRFHFQEAR
jgi:glycosyltransferase involved in cell wall biosynthesis